MKEKVIIWGCGVIGKMVLCPLYDDFNMEVIAYTDSKTQLCEDVYGVPFIEYGDIIQKEFDFVLIAVNSFDAIKEIKRKLLNIGVSEEKIKPMTLNPIFMDALMDQRMFWIRDFARYCSERNLKGNVAECGVFRGDSAKFINKFFSNKTLYLFDTFEGFEESDIEYEMGLQNSSYNNGRFTSKEIFSNTDMELMMGKMQYPDNIQIYKGRFPDTAQEIRDEFCFVNLDMDLYLPMLEGLRFFWRKMVPGGCILLHDYFHPELPGVKKAVDDFERETGVILHKMTIGDGCSIALVIK